ncbi:RagB/SusD family nutrient uptake outer membrane protein [Niabella ginsengisoli]|uniref:RagB/SusD family nutrient uptake outer membrane protein n=1 Tax=Niabella ginsengisoli TaxID=522298 RepID=A0ABS9SHY7_9BACT|nr:RagB/SusD family nutrient uptake outer membrane protein [Niabella ginsengisoli]
MQALLDDAGQVMNQRGTPSFGETSAGDYFILPDRYGSMNEMLQHAYNWEPYDYLYPNDWSICYIPIYNANYCIEMLEKISHSSNPAAWDNVKGSAHFFRAYYFLMLSWVYAKAYDESTADQDLGIVLRLTSDFNVPSKRSSVRESYNQVIADAYQSISYLPDYPLHPFRPSRMAAYGLLARTYISMRNYDSAFKYADQYLQLKNDLINLNGDEDLGPSSSTYKFKQFNKETAFYTEMNANGTISLLLASRSRIDTSLFAAYEPGDLRRTYFRMQNGYPIYSGSYSAGSRQFTGIATDEIYLIRAESNCRKGHLEEALADLNSLLSHRYETDLFQPVRASSKEALLNRILLERRKELLMRGIRWSDVKRLNKEGRNIILNRSINGQIISLEPNSSYYALPIPLDVIQLTGIEQN